MFLLILTGVGPPGYDLVTCYAQTAVYEDVDLSAGAESGPTEVEVWDQRQTEG